MQRSLAFLVTALVMATGVAGCGSDGSDAKAAAPTTVAAASTTTTTPGARKVTWTKTGLLPKLSAPFCDAQKHCVYPGTEEGTFHGDLEGTHLMAGGAALDETGKRFATSRTDLFVGTVKGCGAGTLVMLGTEDATMADGSGDWTIKAGYGTGALKNASGHGTGTGTVSATGIRATFEGEISC